MTNSDSGNKLNPGDRVRIAHNPKHDDLYLRDIPALRLAAHGKAGKIAERDTGHGVCFRVVPDGESNARGAWFEADELSPIVTDPDGCEVGAPASPLDVLDAAVQQALAAARREAQGWHSAALLARGEAEGTQERLAEVEAERDALRGACEAATGTQGLAAPSLAQELRETVGGWEATVRAAAVEEAALRGKLGAAEAKLVQTATERRGWRNEALREQSERKAAEERLAAVAQAWGTLRAWMLALPRPLGAAGLATLDAVDKALGGAKPEREDTWEATLEQRVAEIEARLGRLETMGTEPPPRARVSGE